MQKGWQTLAVIAALVVALCCGGLFAMRAVRLVRQFRNPNEPIRAWMSIPFIAHTHHVPQSVLFNAIGVQPRTLRDRRSVRRLARELNRPVPEVILKLQRAIDTAKAPPGSPPR